MLCPNSQVSLLPLTKKLSLRMARLPCVPFLTLLPLVGNHSQNYRAYFSFCYLACQIKGQEMMKKPQNSPELADFPPHFLAEFGTDEKEGIKKWL